MNIYNFYKKPVFYDLFGFLTFTFLIIISILALNNFPLPNWVFIIILIIGVAGIIVDGTMVTKEFILKNGR